MPEQTAPTALEPFEKTLISLDWPRVLERLASYAGSVPGRERVLGLTFATELEEVRRRLDETSEVRLVIDAGLTVPIGGIRDVRAHVAAAEKGEILIGRELLDVADTLNACQNLRRFFSTHAGKCPRVLSIATRFYDVQELAGLLGSSFDTSGELSTAMYPVIGQLRSRIHALHGRIKDRLSALLSSEDLSGLAQDNYVTVRGDRYVVPLKVQARAMDIGIVHDTSGSGQTVFVEPRQVIPMNNDLKLAEGELRREERKILGELSRRVALEATRIFHNIGVAAELEFVYARARLSQELGAVAPVLVNRPIMRLDRARHPVLALRGVKVVPNDLTIGTEFQALILSGPNTGGKTVALKTLGLCALMTRAGLHIPAEATSQVGIFTHVLSDIGDQQTVEQDLSTFSGHILSIKHILEALGQDGSGALVLLDEIAVGTDPTQGAALARSLLEAFVERGAKVVITTHYGELKTLSVQDRRFANGRVEYDAERFQPTYRVVIGTPGRSYALDIAEKLGMNTELIQRARGYLATSQRALEDLLGELEKSLSQARDERTLAERARQEADGLKRRFEQRLQEVDKEVERLRQKHMSRFEEEVRQARDEITKVVKEMQKTGAVRLITPANAREKVAEVARKVRDLAPATSMERAATQPLDVGATKVGDKVWVVSLKKEGVLASPLTPSEMADVSVGGLRIRVWPDDLRKPGAGTAPKASGGKAAAQAPKPAPSPDRFLPGDATLEGDSSDELAHAFQTSKNVLDLRGMRVDEGLDAVERFLDQASLGLDHIVFIIHGHGTGAMKTAVRDYLKASPYVERFQPGTKHQGGDGATVVALS